MRSALIIILLSLFGFCNAQPSVQWQKSLGGNLSELLYSACQTSDGGCILAGHSYSNDGDVTQHYGPSNSPDYWIVKLSSDSTIEWQKTLGGTSNDDAFSVQQTIDGGYIVAGESFSVDGDVTNHHGDNSMPDFWIVKLSVTGALEWQKSLGGTGIDAARWIHQTSDGGYIVTGYSWSVDGDVTVNHGISDCWIVKLTGTGSIEWQKSYGGSASDAARCILQSSDGGYLVIASSYSNDGNVSGHHGSSANPDYWVVKLNSDGSLAWQQSYGGTDKDEARFARQTADGGYVICGETFSSDGDITQNNGNADYWIIKINASGALEWQKSMGGSESDYAHFIMQSDNQQYIVCGSSKSGDGDVTGHHGDNLSTDAWIVRFDSSGINWQQSYGGSADDVAYFTEPTADGGYLVAGTSNSDDGDISGTHGGSGDYCVLKLSPNNAVEDFSHNACSINIFPNPALEGDYIHIRSNMLSGKISAEIYNATGQRILAEITDDGNLVISPYFLSCGVFLVRLNTGKETITAKFIVQ